MRIAVRGVILACWLTACGSSGGDAATRKPIAVTYAAEQVGRELHVTLTTEPDIRLFTSVQRGSVSWTKAGGTEAWADKEGKAELVIRDAYGANALSVTAANAATLGEATRTTSHRFELSIAEPVPVVITVDDAGPATGELAREDCEGSLEEVPGLDAPRVSLCTGAVALREDFSIGLVVKAAAGRTLTIGDHVFPFADGQAIARIELEPYMAALPLGELTQHTEVFVFPVTLELTGGKRTGNLRLGRAAVAAFLARVAGGPARFAGEPPGPGGKASALVVEADSGAWIAVGADVPLAQLDLVALLQAKQRKGGPCHYVATDGSGERKTLERVARDVTATVHDRRTGAVIGKRTFAPRMPPCDEWVSATDTGGFAQIDDQVITDWVATFVAK